MSRLSYTSSWFLCILQLGRIFLAADAFIISTRICPFSTTVLRTLPPQQHIDNMSILQMVREDGMTLAEDGPLSSKFQRAVVLQRAGDYTSALQEYQTFVQAAKSCDVSPELYAEVHVNMGAVYAKMKDRQKARANFELALKYRDRLGSAHVNLALLALAEGQTSTDPREGIDALKQAEGHCRKAVELNDDEHSVNAAKRLLGDIENMLGQTNA